MITNEFKKRCILMKQQGKPIEDIYKLYREKHPHETLKLESFERNIRRWRKKLKLDEPLLEAGSLNFDFDITRATVQMDGKGKVSQVWAKGVKDDTRAYERLIEAVGQYKPILPKDAQTGVKRTREGKLLEVTFYDMHIGISDYEYYAKTLEKTKYRIQQGFEEIVIPIGSDLFHNDNFRGLTANGTQIEVVDMEKAWGDAMRFYIDLIYTALRHSQRVKVIFIKGNHDESISWAFVKALELMFPVVEFDTGFEERKMYHRYKIFIGFTHGNNNTKDIDRVFAHEYGIEWASSTVKEIHVGHYHTEETKDVFGAMVRRLSTRNKTDRWHKAKGFVGANKRFMLFEYDTDSLESVYYV